MFTNRINQSVELLVRVLENKKHFLPVLLGDDSHTEQETRLLWYQYSTQENYIFIFHFIDEFHASQRQLA